jgi:CelD/BcsL family acetyltransferase involved in cellulose biosynthesis
MVTKLETPAPLRGDRPTADAPAWSVECYDNFDDVRAIWSDLFVDAPASPYQSFPFVSLWFETVGRAELLEPAIAVGRAGNGQPAALLPLAVDRRGPLRILTFLCGRESNFNLGLYRPEARLDEAALRAILLRAAAARGADIVYLRNQPRRLDGVENPLAFACAAPSPSFAYGLALPDDPAALDARASKETRKKLRKKEQRLAALGEIRYEHAVTGARAVEIVQALVAQKVERFRRMGVSSAFDDPAMRTFLERSCDEGAMEAHALSVSGRVVAAYAGLGHRGRFSAMVNSFDLLDEEVARCSPGDLLLRAVLRNLIERGFSRFDLGAGEARYKDAVCDETIELCDLVLAANWKGVLAAPMLAAFLKAKRWIKQTPALARAATGARTLLRGDGAGAR